MGKNKIQEEAQALGLTKQRLTVLYTQPRILSARKFKEYSDVSDALQEYVSVQDRNIIQNWKSRPRKFYYFYLAADIKLYVELFDKTTGFFGDDVKNHVEQISIYCDNNKFVRGIAYQVYSIWEEVGTQGMVKKKNAGGMLENLDWKKIEKTFNVKKEDCIATWNKILSSNI